MTPQGGATNGLVPRVNASLRTLFGRLRVQWLCRIWQFPQKGEWDLGIDFPEVTKLSLHSAILEGVRESDMRKSAVNGRRGSRRAGRWCQEIRLRRNFALPISGHSQLFLNPACKSEWARSVSWARASESAYRLAFSSGLASLRILSDRSATRIGRYAESSGRPTDWM